MYRYVLLCMSFYVLPSEFLDWNPQAYQENSSEQYDMAQWVLKQVPISSSMNILDIGCGDGRITIDIAHQTPLGKVFGVDSSQNMIEFAKQKYADINNVAFILGEIENVVIPVACDIAFAFSSLSWIKNIEQVFSNTAQLLHKEGLFAGLVSHNDCPYIQSRKNVMLLDKWKEYFECYQAPYYSYDIQSMSELLNKAGYSIERIEKANISSLYLNKKNFIDLGRILPIQIERIPHALYEEFFEDIWNEYLKLMPINQEGIVEFPAEMLFFVAKK